MVLNCIYFKQIFLILQREDSPLWSKPVMLTSNGNVTELIRLLAYLADLPVHQRDPAPTRRLGTELVHQPTFLHR